MLKPIKNIKINDIVEFPYECWAPQRHGWNGWNFRVAIVKKVTESKALIEYWLQPIKDVQIQEIKQAWISKSRLFPYKLQSALNDIAYAEELQVPISRDALFLRNKGII